jgi:hypothetical protein
LAHVIVRKGPPTEECPEGKVVIEQWLTVAECQALAHQGIPMEEATSAALKEHLANPKRYRVNRKVHTGRFA